MKGRQVFLPSSELHNRHRCKDPGVGRWVFHMLTNAMREARYLNVKAGEKAYCVVIRGGHFHVVFAD